MPPKIKKEVFHAALGLWQFLWSLFQRVQLCCRPVSGQGEYGAYPNPATRGKGPVLLQGVALGTPGSLWRAGGHVFKEPEDVDTTVKYVSSSFLLKKHTGGFCLVTAFSDVGNYSIDLTKEFYQIPLSRDSWKYCGVVTPFMGVLVHVWSAMGLLGSKTALEELTCRVFGIFSSRDA